MLLQLPHLGERPFPSLCDVQNGRFLYPVHMNETTHPNQNSITLGSLLFLTHFAAGLTAVFLYNTLHNLEPIARATFAFAGAGGMGLLLTINLQRAIRALDWALLHLLTNLPAAPVPARNSLAGLMAKTNLLADRERPLAEQRQAQLQQAEKAAAQQERNRLARDLHDSIKQQLFSIQISAAAAEARLQTDPDGAIVAIADVRGSGKAAMAEMNALLHQLAPAPLEKIGLEQALREQAEALGYRSGAVVSVAITPLPTADQIPTGGEEAIFRIAQEALSNIARHARATAVSLKLTTIADTVTLTIQDDGQGFDPIVAHDGMGLGNMTRRAEKAGGNLTIESRKGNGCTIQAAIPLERTAELKEQLMYKTTQTLNKIGLIGIGGGLLLTVTFIYPLDRILTAQYVTGFFIAIAIGYFAAKGAGISSRKIGSAVGAMAGGIAGLVFYATYASAAAAIIGSQYLLARGSTPAETEGEFLYLITDAVNSTIWWVFGSFFVILAIGALLGIIGAAIAPLTTNAEKSPNWRSLSRLLSIIIVVGLLSATFGLILSVAIFVLLGEAVMANIPEIESAGYSLSLPANGSFFWPLFTPMAIYLSLAALLFLLPYFGQQSATQKELREYAIGTYVGGLVMAGMPIIMFALSIELSQMLFIGWAIANAGIALATLWLAQRLLTQFAGVPDKWGRWAGWGLMLTAVFVTIFSAIGLHMVAAFVWATAVLLFIAIRWGDFKVSEGDKRPFADQIARGLSALVPAVLILILPIIPFMAGSIGIAFPIIPRIKFLEVGAELQSPAIAIETSTLIQQTQQQLYSLNWLILFFPLIFSLALVGIFFAIAKFAAKIRE